MLIHTCPTRITSIRIDPTVLQEFSDAACRLGGRAFQHIAQIGVRVMPVDPIRVHKAHHGSGALPRAQAAGEQPVRPPVGLPDGFASRHGCCPAADAHLPSSASAHPNGQGCTGWLWPWPSRWAPEHAAAATTRTVAGMFGLATLPWTWAAGVCVPVGWAIWRLRRAARAARQSAQLATGHTSCTCAAHQQAATHAIALAVQWAISTGSGIFSRTVRETPQPVPELRRMHPRRSP